MKLNKFQMNIISAVVFVLFGVIIWVVVPRCVAFSDLYSMGVPWLNSYFMPRAMAVLLMATSAGNIALTIIQIKLYKAHGKEAPMPEPLVMSDELRVLLFVLVFVLYYLLIKYVSFIPASVIAAALALLLVKDKKIIHYVIAIGFIVAIYLVFKYVLYVKLP